MFDVRRNLVTNCRNCGEELGEQGCQCDEGFTEPLVIPAETLIRKGVISFMYLIDRDRLLGHHGQFEWYEGGLEDFNAELVGGERIPSWREFYRRVERRAELQEAERARERRRLL